MVNNAIGQMTTSHGGLVPPGASTRIFRNSRQDQSMTVDRINSMLANASGGRQPDTINTAQRPLSTVTAAPRATVPAKAQVTSQGPVVNRAPIPVGSHPAPRMPSTRPAAPASLKPSPQSRPQPQPQPQTQAIAKPKVRVAQNSPASNPVLTTNAASNSEKKNVATTTTLVQDSTINSPMRKDNLLSNNVPPSIFGEIKDNGVESSQLIDFSNSIEVPSAAPPPRHLRSEHILFKWGCVLHRHKGPFGSHHGKTEAIGHVHVVVRAENDNAFIDIHRDADTLDDVLMRYDMDIYVNCKAGPDNTGLTAATFGNSEKGVHRLFFIMDNRDHALAMQVAGHIDYLYRARKIRQEATGIPMLSTSRIPVVDVSDWKVSEEQDASNPVYTVDSSTPLIRLEEPPPEVLSDDQDPENIPGEPSGDSKSSGQLPDAGENRGLGSQPPSNEDIALFALLIERHLNDSMAKSSQKNTMKAQVLLSFEILEYLERTTEFFRGFSHELKTSVKEKIVALAVSSSSA